MLICSKCKRETDRLQRDPKTKKMLCPKCSKGKIMSFGEWNEYFKKKEGNK